MSDNYDDYISSLYRLFNHGVICITQRKKEKIRNISVLLYDKYKLFNKSEKSELLETLNLSENEIVFQKSIDEIDNSDKIRKYAICISKEINDLIRFESKLNENEVNTTKIFIHISDIITILKGSFTKLNEKYLPLDIVGEKDCTEVSKFYKKQILYILSDMINFENRVDLIEKPNVLNIINMNTMFKKQIEF
uniref:hypothetical protein n=1 Tax=Clostridium sp. NkU-1 TaxID=1095009 RepID=UPI0006CF58C9